MIQGITETSFLDWDGRIVTVLYVGPCNFKCGFCHNWELITKPDKYPEKDWDDIRNFLIERHDFLDGVCFTGGEPCLDKDLKEMVLRVKGLGLKVKLDTNGSKPDVLQELVEKELIDAVAMDLKMPLDERYDRAIGVSAPLVELKRSVDILMSSGIEYDIVDIARCIEGAERYVLQQFNPENTWNLELRDVLPYQNEDIESMAEEARKYVKEVVVRGLK